MEELKRIKMWDAGDDKIFGRLIISSDSNGGCVAIRESDYVLYLHGLLDFNVETFDYWEDIKQ